jgi:hypothetical protein
MTSKPGTPYIQIQMPMPARVYIGKKRKDEDKVPTHIVSIERRKHHNLKQRNGYKKEKRSWRQIETRYTASSPLIFTISYSPRPRLEDPPACDEAPFAPCAVLPPIPPKLIG